MSQSIYIDIRTNQRVSVDGEPLRPFTFGKDGEPIIELYFVKKKDPGTIGSDAQHWERAYAAAGEPAKANISSVVRHFSNTAAPTDLIDLELWTAATVTEVTYPFANGQTAHQLSPNAANCDTILGNNPAVPCKLVLMWTPAEHGGGSVESVTLDALLEAE